MLKENLVDFIKEVGSGLKRIFTSRILPFVILSMALFAVLVYRLFVLQIVNGSSYTASYNLKTERTIATTGTRGNIYDCNGELLAYSELAYSVVIEDCGYYESTKIKNEALNSIISQTVSIIEDNGDSVLMDFSLDIDENGNAVYTVKDNALLRFLRDIYGKSAINQLTDEQRATTAQGAFDYLKTRYKISDEYSKEMALKIMYIRINLSANSYKRYISFTIASNVSSTTMASILEHADVLTGVTIEEDSIRKYNYSEYISHIIGYTGKVSETELEQLQEQNDSYDQNDIVGKSGIEAEYETTLAGTKGSQTMLVDSVGRVLEITDQQDSKAGNDVYLTIDVKLQKKIYELLERRLSEILVNMIVNSDTTTAGIENYVVIPVTHAYFALIDNNLIDMDQIAQSQSDAAVNAYSLFSTRKEQINAGVQAELAGGTAYSALSDDLKAYVKLMRTLLINNDIINTDNISSSDELSQQWSDGSISFRQYLEGAITNGWINIYNLDIDSEYPTTEEVLNAVIAEAVNQLVASKDYDKLIYKELTYNHSLSGRTICMLLMEQNAVEYTESEYVSIANGASTYDFLINKISSLAITPAQLALDPCSGSVVMENPDNGSLLAMVTYPGYDINKFSGSIDSDYYSQLLNDKSTPLVNRATQTKIAPGSTFKPLIAIAALSEGVVGANEYVNCDGVFDKVSPNIKCWIYPNDHGSLNTIGALAHSCNDYFCEMGYRLSFTADGTFNMSYGLTRIQKYAELLGISTKTGIQLPEATPHVTDYNPVASAIGQGTNAYTSLNLARYTSTLANSGTVYNTSIVQKIVDSQSKSETVIEPAIANTVDVDASIWPTVHEGMKEVITTGVMEPFTSKLPVTTYGKSGTAQEDKKRGNHACYIMFTTDANGEEDVAVSVMIPYGYAATNAGLMSYYALSAYYGTELPTNIYFTYNSDIVVNE